MCMTSLGHPSRAQSSESAVAALWEVSPSGSRLSFGSEKLSSLFGMTNRATMPHKESWQHRAMALAMGGRPPPSLLREKGAGNFSQHFGCFAGVAL